MVNRTAQGRFRRTRAWVRALGALGLIAGFAAPAVAGSGGAFVGGLIGGHVLTNAANRSERRTQAAESQAYSQPAQTAPASSGGGGQSVEQRLATLDKLAANEYITKDEYKRRRESILNGL